MTGCSQPKVHKAKVKKVVKEKSSRFAQASILQGHEDLTQNAIHFTDYKLQQPGNKKKSGMVYDKKEVLVSTSIILDEAMQTIASIDPEIYEAFTIRARHRVAHHIAYGSSTELPAGSLMTGPSGEGPCLHELNHVECETSIECRKNRHQMHFENNLKKRFMSSKVRSASGQSPAGGRSNSSTPRRH